jgi:hypothetical protein
MKNPYVKLIFATNVNSMQENKFLLKDKVEIDLTMTTMTTIFLIVSFLSYLGLCILIYITKSLIANYFIKSLQNKKGKRTKEEEENTPENSLIHSLHVKYYIFFNKLHLVESYIENNILIDDKTYREFYRNMLSDPCNYDILKSFEEVSNKTSYNKGWVFAELIVIISQIGLLIITNLFLFYCGSDYAIYVYYLLIAILIVLFINFLKLIMLFENIRYINNRLLTSRDKNFLRQETSYDL